MKTRDIEAPRITVNSLSPKPLVMVRETNLGVKRATLFLAGGPMARGLNPRDSDNTFMWGFRRANYAGVEPDSDALLHFACDNRALSRATVTELPRVKARGKVAMGSPDNGKGR